MKNPLGTSEAFMYLLEVDIVRELRGTELSSESKDLLLGMGTITHAIATQPTNSEPCKPLPYLIPSFLPPTLLPTPPSDTLDFRPLSPSAAV